jgi:hypothetical protein
MKALACLFLLLIFADLPTRPEAAIAYFSNVRDVRIAQPDRQNFFTVDEELWTHSRLDLGDLRLYSGESPVEYSIAEQRAGTSSEEVEAKILNLGSVAGHTEFDLDARELPEYDRIHLKLAARDFVATASVSGGDEPGKAANVHLPPSTLYDFTKEQLGSNSQLKIPISSFRYLHVSFSAGVRPQDVKGATIFNVREQQANWTRITACSAPQQNKRTTVISCAIPPRVPLGRVSFHVDPSQVNFRRAVTVVNANGVQVASGEISRVRLKPGDTLVTDEDLSVDASENTGAITLNIDNGDNPPLRITACDALATERRVYFEPEGKPALRLYYGDEKLEAPVYDYARFFHAEASPARAELGPGSHNPDYTGRPDERPWSERHTVVLWTVMVVVVLGLAFVAFRGLRTGSKQ